MSVVNRQLSEDLDPSVSISLTSATAQGGAPPTVARAPRDLPTLSVQGLQDSRNDTQAIRPMTPGARLIENRAASLRIERLIGKGGMGAVYQAVQPSLGRYVAVKRLLRDGEGIDDWRTIQFHQEAVISARLEHPNIVPVHDFGVDEQGTPLLSMKLVHGSSWSERIDRDRSAMNAEDFLATHIPILMQVAQAVAFAHARGIVHRDLKPSQVMLGEFGEVLLMDWGLAIVIADSAAMPEGRPVSLPDPPLALPDSITGSSPCGTPAYMAPEQTRPTAAGIGTWTDVYLLGATLYLLLTGTHPHQAATAVATMERAARGDVEPPSRRAPDRIIPADLEALCLEAMQADPLDRLTSASVFLERLRDHTTGTGRRREAEAIAAETERAIDAGLGDYEACAGAISRLRRGESLNPQSPRFAPLFSRVHQRWAELAIELGDLQLAALQAGQLPAGQARTAIERRIESESRRRRAAERQRRLAVAGAFVLLLALLGSGAVFANRIRQERNTATSRAAASQALSQFMLGDLGDRLDPQLERDRRIIEQIAKQVMAHYRGLDVSNDSVALREAHALDLRRAAEALIDLGRGTDGLELIVMAIRLQRETNPSNHLALLDFHSLESEALHGVGRAADAVKAGDIALEEWELAGKPINVPYTTALNNRASATVPLGGAKEALAAMQQVVDLRLQLLGPHHEETIIAQLNLAIITMVNGDPKSAVEQMTPLVEVARAHLPDGRTRLEVQRAQMAIKSAVGVDNSMIPILAELEAEYLRILGPTHPATVMMRIDGARLRNALSMYEESIAILDEVIGLGESGGGIEARRLSTAYRSRSLAHEARGAHAQALSDSKRALAILEASGEQSGMEFANVLFQLTRCRGDDSPERRLERVAECDRLIALYRKINQTNSWEYVETLATRASLDPPGQTVEERQKLIGEALEASERVLGSKHRSTITLLMRKVIVLGELDQTDELNSAAAEVSKRMLEIKDDKELIETYELMKQALATNALRKSGKAAEQGGGS